MTLFGMYLIVDVHKYVFELRLFYMYNVTVHANSFMVQSKLECT
jgi:hypothetical protein